MFLWWTWVFVSVQQTGNYARYSCSLQCQRYFFERQTRLFRLFEQYECKSKSRLAIQIEITLNQIIKQQSVEIPMLLLFNTVNKLNTIQ